MVVKSTPIPTRANQEKPLAPGFEGSLNDVLSTEFKEISKLPALDTNTYADAAKRALQNSGTSTDTPIDLNITDNLIQALRVHLAQTAILKPADCDALAAVFTRRRT